MYKKTMTNKSATYKDLSEDIYWTCKGYNINYEKESSIIKSYKMNIGDIVYVGSNNDTRPEYGWGFVFDNQGHYLSDDSGNEFLINLMNTSNTFLSNNHIQLKNYINNNNIKYKDAFENIMDSEWNFAWLDMDYYGEKKYKSVVNNYKKYNLW